MANISFESRQQTARFYNPLNAGQMDAQQIELRFDPLTGHQSIFNAALEGKAETLFPATDQAYLLKRAEATQAQCYLCEGRWRQLTPRYDEGLIPGGRIERGEIVLFPNLFPLAAYHAVVMVGNRHFRALNDFPAGLLQEALTVSLDFIRRCHRADPHMRYFTINANYLFPAGASAFHPHLQILGSPFPGAHQLLLLERSRAYHEQKKSCYWEDLIAAEERSGQRTIGELHGSRWFTAFSPVGSNEVNAVWPATSHFLEWGEAELRGMAEGLSRTFRGYFDLGLSTFNFSCFSGPLHRHSPEFRCMLRVINRQNVTAHYRTDDYYFQKLLRNEIIIRRPEQLAEFLRSYF
jgi:UDPglucose--hexose-1-phosphate uridylyltransferase